MEICIEVILVSFEFIIFTLMHFIIVVSISAAKIINVFVKFRLTNVVKFDAFWMIVMLYVWPVRLITYVYILVVFLTIITVIIFTEVVPTVISIIVVVVVGLRTFSVPVFVILQLLTTQSLA